MSTPDDLRPPTDEGVVVRSEEEARITVRTVPYERVRIRKRVVTERHVVELRREELVVEHLPLDEAELPDEEGIAEGELRMAPGEELELVLSYEEVDLVPRVVPYERVRVRREVVADEVGVDASLRVERVDASPDGR